MRERGIVFRTHRLSESKLLVINFRKKRERCRALCCNPFDVITWSREEAEKLRCQIIDRLTSCLDCRQGSRGRRNGGFLLVGVGSGER